MSGLSDAVIAAVLRAEDYARAKRFYSEKLGLTVTDLPGPAARGMVTAASGYGLMIYERPGMPAPPNTTLSFRVPDLDAAMADLRSRGVDFEEYDLPEIGLKTVEGVADSGGARTAWFKDSEDNILVLSQA
jgi:predicted enzyme related to lactoylglutathione lyase